MSLPHFYLEQQVIGRQEAMPFPLQLAADDAKHARVLRLQPGERIAVIDAAQDYFVCEIESFDGDLPLVSVSSRQEPEAAMPQVLLVQGLAKGDKMETVIRHATELGVAGFLPLACERSVVRLDGKKAAAKVQRWQAIAKSAAMQSGQRRIPQVSLPATLSQVREALSQATALLICWEEAPQTARLADAIERGLAACAGGPASARIAVVVGPEGGLAQQEVDALLACNPHASLVSLGPSILRTETAGIVASALTLYELGGLGRTFGQAGEGR